MAEAGIGAEGVEEEGEGEEGGGVAGDTGRLRTIVEREGDAGGTAGWGDPTSTELELRLLVCLLVRSTELGGEREENEEDGEATSPPR